MAFIIIIFIKCRNEKGRENSISTLCLYSEIECSTLKIRAGNLLQVEGYSVLCRIFSEEQRTTGVVDKSDEIKGANVIDPFDRSSWIGNYRLF